MKHIMIELYIHVYIFVSGKGNIHVWVLEYYKCFSLKSNFNLERYIVYTFTSMTYWKGGGDLQMNFI